MNYEEYRAALLRLKEENDGRIANIRARLDAYIETQAYLKKKKRQTAPTQGEALLNLFADRRGLVCGLIRRGGEGYFKARIESEEAFGGFLKEFAETLQTLEGLSEQTGRGVEEQKERLLDAMTKKTEAWLKNKTHNWREGMQDTVLKTQLVGLFDRTIEDLKLFAEGNSAMRTAEGDENARLANSTRKELEKYRTAVNSCYIMDTDGNYAVADGLRKALAKIRKDLPKMASGRIVKGALADIGKMTKALQAEKNAGRKLGLGKKLKDFPEATEETLTGKEKVDELAAAVYVLERLTINQDFFDAMDARIQRRIEGMTMPVDFDNDEKYQALKAKAAECAKEIRKLKADPKCSKVKLAGYVELLKACDAQIKEYENKRLEAVRQSVERAKEISRLQKTSASFKKVGDIFTADSGVSYLERAQIMAETQTYDFRDMYEDFVSALLNGDKETLLAIRAKLQAMVEEFNTRRGRKILDEVDEAERLADGMAFDLDGEVSEFDVNIDEDELGDLLSAYGEEEEPAEEPAVRESGETTTVNTGDYASDDIGKRIQDIFDDLSDI